MNVWFLPLPYLESQEEVIAKDKFKVAGREIFFQMTYPSDMPINSLIRDFTKRVEEKKEHYSKNGFGEAITR